MMTVTKSIAIMAAMAFITDEVATSRPAKRNREQIQWVKKHAVRIRSIDPADENFADLNALRTAIGDSRVVILGEETHGDGATFVAKVRLIKFLHREMGFDVVAWESGLNECRHVGELLRDESIPVREAVEGIFPLWATTAQVKPLWEYVRASQKTKHPITIAGIDCQLTSRHSTSYLSTAVRQLFEKIEPSPLTEDVMLWEPALEAYLVGMRYAKSLEVAEQTKKQTDTEAVCRQLLAIVRLIEDRREDLVKHTSRAEVEFVRRAFVGAEFQVRLTHATTLSGSMLANARMLGSERDRLMGENLTFLANEMYPNRKIILWCATMHALRRAPEVKNPFFFAPDPFKGVVTLGEVAHRDLGNAMYIIGFTAGHGSHGWYNEKETQPVLMPGRDSIELYCSATKWPFLFIDFRSVAKDHWLRKPQLMRPMAYQYAKAVWPEQMDAVIYIDEMFKATVEELSPQDYNLSVPAR